MQQNGLGGPPPSGLEAASFSRFFLCSSVLLLFAHHINAHWAYLDSLPLSAAAAATVHTVNLGPKDASHISLLGSPGTGRGFARCTFELKSASSGHSPAVRLSQRCLRHPSCSAECHGWTAARLCCFAGAVRCRRAFRPVVLTSRSLPSRLARLRSMPRRRMLRRSMLRRSMLSTRGGPTAVCRPGASPCSRGRLANGLFARSSYILTY